MCGATVRRSAAIAAELGKTRRKLARKTSMRVVVGTAALRTGRMDDVTTIAPASITHPTEYEIKASDIANLMNGICSSMQAMNG